jgi:hypothetical protein
LRTISFSSPIALKEEKVISTAAIVDSSFIGVLVWTLLH